MSALRWVRRNTDKPHRCPECHAVATWDHKTVGPRTRLKCPRDCAVQWRAGFRMIRWPASGTQWGRQYRKAWWDGVTM